MSSNRNKVTLNLISCSMWLTNIKMNHAWNFLRARLCNHFPQENSHFQRKSDLYDVWWSNFLQKLKFMDPYISKKVRSLLSYFVFVVLLFPLQVIFMLLCNFSPIAILSHDFSAIYFCFGWCDLFAISSHGLQRIVSHTLKEKQETSSIITMNISVRSTNLKTIVRLNLLASGLGLSFHFQPKYISLDQAHNRLEALFSVIP